MKKMLFLVIMLLFAANMAFAQSGAINIFSDPGGVSCDHNPLVGTLYLAYAVHIQTPGATASNWSAPVPACSQPWMLWLSDAPVFPVTLGNSQTGVSIGYGACLGSPIHILTLQFFVQGVVSTCCVWPVLPDPTTPSGLIEVVDCGGNLLYGGGGFSIINPDPTCGCREPVPTEETTWGGVKALYTK